MKQVQPQIFVVSETHPLTDGLVSYLESLKTDENRHAVEGYIEESFDGEDPPGYYSSYLVEFGGRLCYRSWAPGLNANVTKIRKGHDEYVGNIISSGHGSVLEHVSYGIMFKDISRIITHEIVRHRAGCAYSQESLRFVRLSGDDLKMWIPTWAEEDPELAKWIYSYVSASEKLLQMMNDHFFNEGTNLPFSEKKKLTSFMRRFAPSGLATDLLVTANVRAWRHMLTMRTALGAEEEIRLVFRQVADALFKRCVLFQDMTISEQGEVLFAHPKV